MKQIIFSVLVGLSISMAAHADVTGTYKGSFDGRVGTLVVSNSGAYNVAFQGDDGVNDLIGAGCNSIIGKVEKVSEKKGEVRKIRFEFSPGNCSYIFGNELTVYFKAGKANLEIYSHSEDDIENCYPDHMGRRNCDRFPGRNVFLTGEFKRE